MDCKQQQLKPKRRLMVRFCLSAGPVEGQSGWSYRRGPLLIDTCLIRDVSIHVFSFPNRLAVPAYGSTAVHTPVATTAKARIVASVIFASMHSQPRAPSLSTSAACQHSSLAASRSSAPSPLLAHRQQHALRQPSTDHAHRLRHGACSATDSSGQGPEDMYRDVSASHQAPNGDYEGPQLVPLDVESSMGLGGTSEDVFGELVGGLSPMHVQAAFLLRSVL